MILSIMNKKDYTTSIEVAQPPQVVVNCINDISKWWTKDVAYITERKNANLNDEFSITHPGMHYSKHKVVEIFPNKKIVWLVTESKLDWLEKDKAEWTGTKMIFELTPNGDNTIIHFTHEGLGPEKECYARVAQAWDMVINEWLFNFIMMGKAI